MSTIDSFGQPSKSKKASQKELNKEWLDNGGRDRKGGSTLTALHEAKEEKYWEAVDRKKEEDEAVSDYILGLQGGEGSLLNVYDLDTGTFDFEAARRQMHDEARYESDQEYERALAIEDKDESINAIADLMFIDSYSDDPKYKDPTWAECLVNAKEFWEDQQKSKDEGPFTYEELKELAEFNDLLAQLRLEDDSEF